MVIFMRNGMIIHTEELSKKWIDRLFGAGVRVLGIHPRGGREAADTLAELAKVAKTQEFRALIDYARERGLEIEYEFHAMGYLLPRELFSEHPEYFRMNEKGERTEDWNLCASSSEALGIVAKRAARLAKALYGSSHRFHFWMDDGGHGLRCLCPKCKELSASDQQMIVLNCIQNELKKHFGDASLAYLAYMDTLAAPTGVIAADGIFLEYAPFEKYTAKGENAAFLIEHEKNMIPSLMKYFESRPKKVLEYWYDNSMYSRWKKPPAKFVLRADAMREDINGYRELGFDSISTFACFLGDDYEKLYGEVDVKPFGECFD